MSTQATCTVLAEAIVDTLNQEMRHYKYTPAEGVSVLTLALGMYIALHIKESATGDPYERTLQSEAARRMFQLGFELGRSQRG